MPGFMQPANIDEARRIFGADVLGPEEIVGALGSVSSSAVPRLSFPPDVLMRGADEGMMLVLRMPHAGQDAALTISALAARLSATAAEGADAAWFAREPFALQTCTLGWALVDKQPFAQSRNLSYPEQETELVKRSTHVGVRLRRRTAVEIVYDTLLYAAVRGERLLEKDWDWSSSPTSDGGFVTAGQFDARGLRLLGYSQAVRFDSLGICATCDAPP
jgi:hypothetical protein